jgi:hypothetical protein
MKKRIFKMVLAAVLAVTVVSMPVWGTEFDIL